MYFEIRNSFYEAKIKHVSGNADDIFPLFLEGVTCTPSLPTALFVRRLRFRLYSAPSKCILTRYKIIN